MTMTYYCLTIYRKSFFLILLIITSTICLCSFFSLHDVAASSEIGIERELEIVKSIPFNDTIPSSIAVDSSRNLVFVSVKPSYPHDIETNLCNEENDKSLYSIPDSVESCSTIYIIDGNTGEIKNIIRLRQGEIIHDMDIDINPHKGKIYAVGEYNYLQNDTNSSIDDKLIQKEDDVVYGIYISGFNKAANYESVDNINETSSRTVDVNEIARIRLYGEIAEGKEGDMSSISVDYNKIYAGIRYFQGGREGVYVIDDSDYDNNATQVVKFIPLGGTGPDQILSDKRSSVYASLEDDNIIAVFDGESGNIKEEIILQKPRAMSINPSAGLLYVSSGDNRWFNIIDMDTNKVIAASTQISHPIASIVNHMTDRVYVANCLLCDQNDYTNGTSIHELNVDGSTIHWENYENIDIEENELAINPITDKLYMLGTDIQSKQPSLYIIDIS
jgi:DNA-binding beta-propeller fold protein YncE